MATCIIIPTTSPAPLPCFSLQQTPHPQRKRKANGGLDRPGNTSLTRLPPSLTPSHRKTDLHEEKNIPAVVKTLVALEESAPRTCPKFTGAKLNMRNFAWSTKAVSSSSCAGTSQVKSFPRRASSGVNGSGISNGGARSSSAFCSNGSSGSSGKIGGGVWPRVGGSGGGGLVAAAVTTRSGGSRASAVGNPPNGGQQNLFTLTRQVSLV